MPPKKSRAVKSGLNYDSLIHYIKHDAYPKDIVSDHEKRNIRKRAKSFRLEQGPDGDKLYFVHIDDRNVRIEKEVVYKHEDQQRVFDEFHINSKGAHLGREKLLNLVSEKYYWQGICQKIREFLRGCKECQEKHEAQEMKKYRMATVMNADDYLGISTKVEGDVEVEVEMESDLSSVSFSDSWITSAQLSVDPRHFWDIVEVKLLGPYQCNGRMKHIMMFMDVFSLWPEAAIVETMSSTVVTHVIINLICRFGVMNKLLLGDTADDTENPLAPRCDVLMGSDININVLHTSAPQTVETWNEIRETMNHFVANNPDWTNCLSFALLPHRISRGRNAEYSPAFLTYGRELNLPVCLTHQPSQEYLQTSDGYLPVDKKKETLNSLLYIYKGYCGQVNISQESDVFKTPLTNNRILRKRRISKILPSPSVVETVKNVINDISENTTVPQQRCASIFSEENEATSTSVMSEEESINMAEVEIKQEVDTGEEQEMSNAKKKRWSKTHRTSMDNSSNNSDDLTLEELEAFEKLLEIDQNIMPEKLMTSDEIDPNYEALILYLKHKKYSPNTSSEYVKRTIRKSSESHFTEDDILFHTHKTKHKVVPLKFDERYYILEQCHTDKGKHLGFRHMYEKLSNFYWKGMIVDCEAYVRTCVLCNQSKCLKNESLPKFFYDETDEERAKIAEENYSLLVKYLQKGKLTQSVQQNKSKLISALANWFTMKSGQLFYKRPGREYDVCLEIATRSKKNAIRDAHTISGLGQHANHVETLQNLSEKYIWYGMKDNCEDFVSSCCSLPKPACILNHATFKKFDLQQRVSLFQKIREMQEKEVDKCHDVKTKVLEKFKAVLEDDDYEGDDEELVELEPDDKHKANVEKRNNEQNIEKNVTSQTLEKLSKRVEKADGIGDPERTKNGHKQEKGGHKLATTGTMPSEISQSSSPAILNKDLNEHSVMKSKQILKQNEQKQTTVQDTTLTGSQQKTSIEPTVLEAGSEAGNSTIKLLETVCQQQTSRNENTEQILVETNQLCSTTIIEIIENVTGNQQHVQGTSPENVEVQEHIIICSPDNIQENPVIAKLSNIQDTNIDSIEQSNMENLTVESRPTQTEYSRCMSDEATLSAVRSILPSAEDNDSDEATESDSEETDNDASDPDWSMEDGQKSENPEVIENISDPSKEPDWEKLKKRYDNKTRFLCKHCGKCVKGIIRYRTHIYEHTGVKPFVCEYCPKRFTTPKTKKLHMLRHSGIQQFLCNLCGKGFSTGISLKSHIAVHEKGGNIQVKCEHCPRVFTSRNRYEKHVHFKHPSSPEIFRCHECNRDFTTKRSLIRHNKSLHQNIKGHICDICGKGFYRKEYLRSHLTTHGAGARSEKGYVKSGSIQLVPNSGDKYEVGLVSAEVTIPHTVHYTTASTIVGGDTITTEYTIPLSEEHHIAIPSTTVENQMTVEPSYYISHGDDENQVAHMLVYEQPAVQYEVECGSTGEQMDAAEALSAINMLAQASISQGY